jgi:hypothetical protein
MTVNVITGALRALRMIEGSKIRRQTSYGGLQMKNRITRTVQPPRSEITQKKPRAPLFDSG